jgi:hypothetical protein
MMTRFTRLVQTYLLAALPFVIACMAWGQGGKGWLWEILSWNVVFWFAMLVVFLVLLVAVPSAREIALRRLANLRDRDEREQLITGRAARAAYVSTLSLLILALFLSVFTLNVSRAPEGTVGKRGSISIGLGFRMFDEPREVRAADGTTVVFESNDLPLSKSALILLFIAWQLASFNWSARRELS